MAEIDPLILSGTGYGQSGSLRNKFGGARPLATSAQGLLHSLLMCRVRLSLVPASHSSTRLFSRYRPSSLPFYFLFLVAIVMLHPQLAIHPFCR